MTPTWADIESRSLFDPVLHAAVTLVRQGMSREDALVVAALSLSEQVSITNRTKVAAMAYGTGYLMVRYQGVGEFSYHALDPETVVIKAR